MAVVYVLQKEGSNYFKVGRCRPDAASAHGRPRTGKPRPLVLFREIQTDDANECEGMFHRLLASKRVRQEGGTEFFETDCCEMTEQIDRIERIFSQVKAARSTVQSLLTVRSVGGERRPEQKDLELSRRLHALWQERSALELQIELLELKIKERIGEAAGIEGIATWRMQDRRCFNEQIFRDSQPEMYERTLERFHCLDTSSWKRAEPDDYREIQTTCCRMSSGRVFRLLP